MRSWTKHLPVDFVIGIDPGYATQGVSVFDVRKPGPPVWSRCDVLFTDSSTDIWTRLTWQIKHIHEIMDQLGYFPTIPANVLLLIEEFHNTGHIASPTAVYYRGMYDALLRERFMVRAEYKATLHPMHVREFSSPYGNKKKSPDRLRDSVFDGTPQGVINYIKALWPEIIGLHCDHITKPFFSEHLAWLGGKPTISKKSQWVSHGTDAMVMGVVGLLAYVYPEMREMLHATQQEKIEKIRETYQFSPSQSYR